MTNHAPSDEGISAMVDILRMSGLHLNPSQRSELDGLIAHGLRRSPLPARASRPDMH